MSDRISETAPYSLTEQLMEESDAMARHVLGQGIALDSGLADRLQSLDNPVDPSDAQAVAELARTHSLLCQLVTPATPLSLLFLQREARTKGPWGFLGPIGLIRRLTAVAVLSMVALFSLSLSTLVDGDPSNFSLLKNSGLDLLLNELFLLSAASLGVSFANLYQAQLYLGNHTFDPRYESSYWVRYVLGLMSGTILAFLIPIEAWLEAGSTTTALHGMGKPTLALLGGFSTQAIYRFLFQMVNAVESLVRGNSQDTAQAQEAKLRLDADRRDFKTRTELSERLRQIRDTLPAGDPITTSLTLLSNNLAGVSPLLTERAVVENMVVEDVVVEDDMTVAPVAVTDSATQTSKIASEGVEPQ